jgi:hypothetical protein
MKFKISKKLDLGTAITAIRASTKRARPILLAVMAVLHLDHFRFLNTLQMVIPLTVITAIRKYIKFQQSSVSELSILPLDFLSSVMAVARIGISKKQNFQKTIFSNG